MSAQAVLAMIASRLPATPRGPSGGDEASGFRGLLAALRSDAGESARPTTDPERPTESSDPEKIADAEPLVLPGAVDAKAPEPQVLPGGVVSKDAEPQVLPGTVVKAPEPQVLPGSVGSKVLEPQVLPGTAPSKDPEPLVLPGTPVVKAQEPQVLPGTTQGKNSEPQILPAAVGDITLPLTTEGDSIDLAPPGPTGDPIRPPGAVAASLQPAPPPLRALAERTSKPLDGSAPSAPSPSSADAKAFGAAASSPATPTDQPAKPTPPPAPTGTAPQADASVPAPEEGATGGSATTQTEAPAPAREHSLSTLSRATVDATALIAAQILRKLEGRSTRFEITLKPAELGRVDVKLDVDTEGRLTARLAFDNPAAATDLRGRADELRRQLEAAGFHLADDAFEFAERDSGSSAFDRGQDARHGSNRAFAAAARLNTETDVAQPPQWLALSLSPAGVDMKV